MLTRAPLLFGVLFLCVSARVFTLGFQSVRTELEGSWEGEKSVVGSMERTLKSGEVVMTFTGDKLVGKGTVTRDEQPVPFKLDGSATPKTLDYVSGGKTTECIYMVDGDRLTIAIPRSPKRPTSFTPVASSVIIVLRRKK